MSIVGLDFGSHTASIAIWFDEKDSIEVIADDLGSRTIPCVVAFRGEEIITGQSAVSQQHKNAANTFDNVRAMLMKEGNPTSKVPVIEKELTSTELVSNFFRNIHNQIKQQVGKPIRDCIISVPAGLSAEAKQKMVESAQAGGVRIKSFIDDSAAVLLAFQLDDPTLAPTKTLVVDIGWSSSALSLFDVSAGLFVPLKTVTTKEVCGELFVKLLATHCSKDFMRKAKFPCDDNKKAMMRLRRECENAMKSLSTGQEATIDIDSLCEGVDYSSKISRARFEDLLTIPFLTLKNSIKELLTSAAVESNDVNQICLAGGLSAIPKVISIVKSLFPDAKYPPRLRFDAAEAPCIGAAQHGKYLVQQGLIDKAPTESPVAASLLKPISIGDEASKTTIFPVNCILPSTVSVPASLGSEEKKGFFKIFVGDEVAGEASFSVEASTTLTITTTVSETAEISIEVTDDMTKVIVGNLTIPGSA